MPVMAWPLCPVPYIRDRYCCLHLIVSAYRLPLIRAQATGRSNALAPMRRGIPMPNHQNYLLSHLPAVELAVLERNLEPVEFAIRQELVSQDTPIEHVFFIEA